MPTYLPPELDNDDPLLPPAQARPRPQAQRVLDRFGVTPYGMSLLLGCNAATVYRWLYDRPRGTGGVIPAQSLRKITAMARTHGVLLTAEDLDPRPR